MDRADSTRLFLVTPTNADAGTFPQRLGEALGAGEVAAVLIDVTTGESAQALATSLVPMVQEAGVAALIADDTRLAGRLGADGVQVGTGLDDLRMAAESFRPKRIVGAGGLTSRHTAMQAGEMDIDYVFFGRAQGDTHDSPHPKALDLAAWWSELMEVPAVIMAGRSLDSVSEAAATGAAFVALNEAVWSYAGGPADAVSRAEAVLRSARRAA